MSEHSIPSVLQYAKQLEFDKVLTRVAEYAASEDAKEAIQNLRPATDFLLAEEMMEKSDAIFRLLQKKHPPAYPGVSGIPEIAFRAKKGGMLSIGELLKVHAALSAARSLSAWYSDANDAVATDGLFYDLYEDASLERRIREAVLSEAELSDAASAELGAIRRRILRAEGSIRDRLDDILRSDRTKKFLQDGIVTMRNGRFVVPVKAENRGEIRGLIHDVSQSGSTYFVEPEAVVEANNRVMELKAEEAREIERILTAFSDEAGAVAERLIGSYRAFVDIDVLIAKGKYAVSTAAARPVLNDAGRILFKKARHPLIPKDQVIPVDVAVGGDCGQLVITGPNTGGKTVTLKTVGLLTLMAMSGILIPAGEGSEAGVFDLVLADIGDEQSIEQNLSTFSGHMTNIARILAAAGRRSLVLLDELGAGTDPAEGAALAIAILARLGELGSRVAATTHYGEIKLYAMQTPGVENASAEFDMKTLRPTYRLTMGIPGMSNALVIAERLGFDAALIERAKEHMNPGNRRFEDVLREIEQLRGEASDRVAAAEEQERAAEAMVAEAESEAERIRREAEKHYDRAQHRSKQMMADVEMSAYRLLDEIKRLDSEKNGDRQRVIARAREIAKKESAGLLREIPREEAERQRNLPPLADIRPGMRAFVLSIGQVGEVLSGPDSGGNVQIRSGPIKTRVHRDLLRAAPDGMRQKKPESGRARSEAAVDSRSGKNEINLLGMNVDEAILETDRFIDGALLGNLSTVYLIHGKGTGALRAGLQRHLRGMKQVKSFRLGDYGEGESGVTIVELR